MKKNHLFQKSGVVGIIVIFICASFVSSGYSEETDQIDADATDVCELQENVVVTCRTFGFPGEPSQEITMSLIEAESFYNKIKDLQIENALDPLSEKTQQLQHEIITLADEYNLLPAGLSPDVLKSRFNPSWTIQNRRLGTLPLPSKSSELFCTFVSTGSGGLLPIIVLPRLIPIIMTPIPRLFMIWNANEAITSCGGLLSGNGFIAYGQQRGLALGFWGIGFTFSLPPFMGVYGLAGYALYARVNAEEIEFYPPNRPPVISSENPPSGTWDVPVSLSELSFRIEDADGDHMSYSVTTDPYIGSGSGSNKKNGFYSVSVSGLDYDKIYRWTVEVTDGKETVEEQSSFITEGPPPFDPFNEGWQYRKEITIDHTKVVGDLENFPVLISTIDSDLRDKAQDGGNDILFMDGSGVAQKLYHEIEHYDGSTGELVAWVNVPIVTDDEDTFFYMYYGNPDCGNQQVMEGTWYDNYVAVYHMNDIGNGILDSTAYNRDSTGYGGNPTFQQTGISGYAIDFDGDGDQFHLPHNFNLGSSDIALEVWIKATSWPDYGQDSCAALTFTGEHYLTCGRYRNKYGEDDLEGFCYCIAPSGSWNNLVVKHHPPINSWIYIAGAYDNDVGAKAFYNSVLSTTDNSNGDLRTRSLTNLIGVNFNGLIDEVRVSKIKRSNDWIETTYNSINNSSNFFSVGPEESGP